MTSLLVGCYTNRRDNRSAGVVQFDFNDATGAIVRGHGYDTGPNPSFITLNAAVDLLFAANEIEAGELSSYRRDRTTGQLTSINSVSAHGAATCHLSLSNDEQFLFAVNYTGGTICVVPVAANGAISPATCVVDHASIGIAPRRNATPHPHMIRQSADGRFVIVTDLGLDSTFFYRFDSIRGMLTLDLSKTIRAETGAGPRHFDFSPNNATLYVINELDSTLDVLSYADGVANRLQTISSLPAGIQIENSTAQVLVSSDGRFVYGSNRGHNSIAIWPVTDVDGKVGDATFVGTSGSTPRNFSISPDGDWLVVANEDSDNIVVFRRDLQTGDLTPVGNPISVATPVCVVFAD